MHAPPAPVAGDEAVAPPTAWGPPYPTFDMFPHSASRKHSNSVPSRRIGRLSITQWKLGCANVTCGVTGERFGKVVRPASGPDSETPGRGRGAQAKEVEGVIARIRTAIEHYGITPDQLFGKARRPRLAVGSQKAPARKSAAKGKPVAIKYRDGDNTWTGRGNKPRWLVARLEEGKQLADFAVS